MGAIGDSYASVARLKARIGIPDSKVSDDGALADSLLTASRAIERFCHRQFHKADVATARWYTYGATGMDVDDFWTDDDLAITPYLGANPSTTWAAADLDLEPVNGVRDGVPGWPFERIGYARYGWAQLGHMYGWAGYRIQVTAKWGWAAVPKDVESACLILAAEDRKLGDAPFGVAGFGDYAIRIRQNPKAAEKLAPYVKTPILVAS